MWLIVKHTLVHPIPKHFPPKQSAVLRPSHNEKWRKMRKQVLYHCESILCKKKLLFNFLISMTGIKTKWIKKTQTVTLRKLNLKEHSVFHRMKIAKNVSIVYVDHVSQIKITDRCDGYQSQLEQTNEIGSWEKKNTCFSGQCCFKGECLWTQDTNLGK